MGQFARGTLAGVGAEADLAEGLGGEVGVEGVQDFLARLR